VKLAISKEYGNVLDQAATGRNRLEKDSRPHW